MMNFIKGKIRNIITVNLIFIVPLLLLFVINNGLLNNGLASVFGLKAGNVNIGTFSYWLLHADFHHLIGNLSILIPLLLIVTLFEEKPLLIIIGLIIITGLIHVFMAASNSIHIGASGLVFALFSYILSQGFWWKSINWKYFFVAIGLVFYYAISMAIGLIPSKGISFSGHFSGLIAGIILVFLMRTWTQRLK